MIEKPEQKIASSRYHAYFNVGLLDLADLKINCSGIGTKQKKKKGIWFFSL
jgi:hypothetical protein